VLDATSGNVLAQRQVPANFLVAFSPSRGVRYEFESAPGTSETTVRAHVESAASSLLWQRTVAGILDEHVAAGEQGVAFAVSGSVGQLVVLSAEAGVERARIDLAVKGLACCRDNRLLVSTRVAPSVSQLDRLVEIDLATLEQSIVLELFGLLPPFGPREVVLSADRSLGFWVRYNGLKLSMAYTSYNAVDLATGLVVATGNLGTQILDIDVDARTPCMFNAPTSFSVGPEGGLVDIPVTPLGSCDPWSAHWRGEAAIVNSGPHVGAATLHLVVPPTPFNVIHVIRAVAVGRTIEITQLGARPSTPELSARIVDDRLVASWTITTGARPNEFVVRGGLRGGDMVPLATVPAATRTWTSAPLLPGSYAVEVLARNYGGDGPASNRVELSHGLAVPPDAPVNLSASVADDVVTLSWSSATSGPTPSGYVIEAALPGSEVFVPVLRVQSPHAYASRVPPGTWQVRVRAFTDGGASDPSNAVNVTSTPCSTAPGAPSALRVMPVAGIVTLRWNAPASGGVEQYIVEGTMTASFDPAVRLVVDGSQRVFESPVPSGIYHARVRARNACGESAPTNEVIAYVP
jgi:hypothetical protein